LVVEALVDRLRRGRGQEPSDQSGDRRDQAQLIGHDDSLLITGIAICCARAASGHAAATPPSAASNSRRPMMTVIRPSRARCVSGTIARHECVVFTFKEGRMLVAVVRLRGRKPKGSVFRFAPERWGNRPASLRIAEN